MYEVGINQRMSARHRLPEATAGERDEHAHHYLVEAVVRGEAVDELGYLVDIDELKASMTEVLDRYRGRFLNELDDFASSAPSLENLSRAIWSHLAAALPRRVSYLAIKVWEDDLAWAGYGRELGG
jgi:6-pyruvoyltetrahydropterin/6-carboxytetrahydropterin synthase